MNQFGRMFRVAIYGESHGDSIGVVIDGAKPGLEYNIDEMKIMLEKRKPNSLGTTNRKENDEPIITSGIFNGFTTGAPINVMFKNENTISKDYKDLLTHPRPGHADFVANSKYDGFQDYRGGGHFSGRMTLGIVAAGYFASKMIPYKVKSKLIQVGEKKIVEGESIDSYINQIVEQKDSVGGIIEITVSDMQIGLGEPFFDSVESILSHILFSIPAVKGVEFGLGFRGISKLGSEFNDCLIDEFGKTKTNNNGGINGGISNGNDIAIRVMIKPTPSIYKEQLTFDFSKNEVTPLNITGRHDCCIARRAMVVLESAVAIGLADLMLMNKKNMASF